jgi:hypothetical protein
MRYYEFSSRYVKGGQASFFTVPSDIAQQVAAGQDLAPVCGEANGLAYRSALRKADDTWLVELSSDLVESGRFDRGASITATMGLDIEPRESSIPYELTEALGKSVAAEKAWESLTDDERTPYCQWVGAIVEPHKRWERARRAAAMVRRGDLPKLTNFAEA